uniref:lipopolysaccharide heptosyltransferase II n=1 Tax=Cyanothece sp. (strain PCC 7425 / ATCC 29141) TaxID=395961 RepID=B8HSR7_CYAP4
MTNSDWDQAEHLLCIRLDSLGDVLMTTPAFRALKAAHPDRQLTLLTSPQSAAVAPLIPEIDRVMTYAAPWMKATPPRADAGHDRAFIQQLGQQQFDGAIIFTVFSQNPLPAAWLCYLADIPRRLAHCHENPYQLLTDWIPDPEPAQGIRHEVQRQLDLVAQIGCFTKDQRLSLHIPQRDRQTVIQHLATLGVELTRPWLLIHPGATAPSRRYAPNRFAAVADRLFLEGYQILLTGTQPEQPLIEQIQQQMAGPSFSLLDRLNLAELAALIALSPLLITNNTGPAHLAAAVGTPVIDLYALTNPQHTPWQVPHRVLFHDVDCKYCFKSICPQQHHHCLSLLTPADVVTATLDLLRETAGVRERSQEKDIEGKRHLHSHLGSQS